MAIIFAPVHRPPSGLAATNMDAMPTACRDINVVDSPLVSINNTTTRDDIDSGSGETIDVESAGGNVWVGGSSGKGFTDDTSAFIAESYGNVHPFVVPNLNNKDQQISLWVGYPNDGTDSTTVCAWQNNNGGFYVMRWDMDTE